MDDHHGLRDLLEGLQNAGYGAYKRLRDTRWALPHATLSVERVQADPFAPPSRLRVDVDPAVAGIPFDLVETEPRRRALADHLLRLVGVALDAPGGSGFHVDMGGQEVLTRSACTVGRDGVTVRLGASLPARGRKILGSAAADLLTGALPTAIADCLRWSAIDTVAARHATEVVEDAVELRAQLAARGLVAFVGDGAVLPRRSGIDQRPLADPGVVAFESPESMRVALEAPHAGTVTGMGVPEGVTLIVGGGFHGKSTLLRALERGVYDHVAGDGRERVVTRPDAAKVRAEDGRAVTRVDVSPFVGTLPTGTDTRDFSTANASGSTSQAATIMEALEVGAGLLLIDEDTSATNLMVRDARMRALVPRGSEPLTPFVDLVRPLHRTREVSTVLVAGGSGDYLGVADRVVHADSFRFAEVTAAARRLTTHEGIEEADVFPAPRARVPVAASIDARSRGKPKMSAKGVDALRFGDATIDLGAVEQLVDGSQATGVGLALRRLAERGWVDGRATLAEALDAYEREVAEQGPSALAAGFPGDFALPRPLEVACALNRLRTLEVSEVR